MSHAKLMIGGVYIQEKLMSPILKGEMWVQDGESITPKESSLSHSVLNLLRPRGVRR